MADIVFFYYNKYFVIEKTTIINEVRLLACERSDRASIISSNLLVTQENIAPVQFNPTCLNNGLFYSSRY